MGDHAAVDIAQGSHVKLLKSYAAMREGEVLTYREPVPYPASGLRARVGEWRLKAARGSQGLQGAGSWPCLAS